jgi:nitroimidazol reductase NimA-like FMN-containing flavoprotein (pyridoxamine 5'-phosphate oxidase superfamily)
MYQSIIGIGKVAFIDETENKIKALKTIISQYSDRQMDIPQVKAKAAVVFQVNIENMTFKQGPV